MQLSFDEFCEIPTYLNLNITRKSEVSLLRFSRPRRLLYQVVTGRAFAMALNLVNVVNMVLLCVQVRGGLGTPTHAHSRTHVHMPSLDQLGVSGEASSTALVALGYVLYGALVLAACLRAVAMGPRAYWGDTVFNQMEVAVLAAAAVSLVAELALDSGRDPVLYRVISVVV